ncbi:MAG: DUF2950 domain-containing protein [Proteobacteria bacterium]|nr:DUF2950 domain-containing protein [Pseudomonadota bacterium]
MRMRLWGGRALALLAFTVLCARVPLAQETPAASAPASAGIPSKGTVAVATFATAKDAADAFIAAVKANGSAALMQILGEKAADLLSTGDPALDEKSRLSFIKNYDAKHALVYESKDRVTLTVGTRAWPLPFPIVRTQGAWSFDAEAGAQELAYRRIGHNELDAMRVMRALADAQKTYAASAHDGNPAGAYAQRVRSKPGTQDGLYWPVGEDGITSPAGDLLAEASTEETAEGTAPSGKPTPFHGYYYRVLRKQGEHAPGGARDYVIDGRMTGGFAILAWPAEYGRSGIMTFMLAQSGKLYQSDLGDVTGNVVKGLRTFDPDSTWRPVP